MIYAELQYDQHYSEVHGSLVELMGSNFENVEHGLQGDSWIWILKGEDKVAIDTFSSMKHQIKSSPASEKFVRLVIQVLSVEFELSILPEPEIEAHEES
jgi:hypothetical protein